MSTNLEWFQKAFFNISRDQDVTNNLSDIKIALTALNYNQLKYTSSSLNLSNIFDCLNSSNKNQIKLACEVLKTFLNALDPTTILSQYGIAMLRALNHPNVEVKELVLQELNRAASDAILVPKLCEEKDLLLSIVACVGHPDNTVARPAIQFLVCLGSAPQGTNALFSQSLLEALNNVAQSNDINRFRVYEIVVEVSAVSQPGLEASKASGLLTKLLSELKNCSDILITLNTLEFVTKLALTQHGYQYLESEGVVRYLADKLTHMDDDLLMSLVLPGLIKFFGNVAQLRPQETFHDYPEAINAIFMSTQDRDQNLVLVALETFGYITTTTQGKWILHKTGTHMKEIMSKIMEIICKWPTESRVRVLNVLANLLRLKVSEQDTEMLALVKGWFGLMGPPDDVMVKIAEMAQQPFAEIKLAVLLLLQVLAEQPWSQQCIHNTPGLVELLLDRNSDSTMLEKTARFSVIESLAESPTSEAVFGEEMVKQFQKFTKDGTVYVQMQTEVAIEKAD